VRQATQGIGAPRPAAEAGVDVAVEVLDVTDDAAASRVIERVQPWALVNNAAYMNAGLLEDVSLDEARRQYDVMLFAPVRLTQLALPGMRRRGGGRIVNISSVAGGV
jgi:NAD(P)-dependent dehydrogenase (short-subunit alcohol dehydrogenase family)